MSPRLFDRLAATASVLILIGLGMVSYYFAQQADQIQNSLPVIGRPGPDYFVEHMALMRADASGKPSVRIEASQMLHYPLDGRVDFNQPRIISLNDSQPLITITARHGSAPDSGDYADLRDDVQVVRAASAEDPVMTLTTQHARVNMTDKSITTADPVNMQAGPNQLQGIGMEIHEQIRQLRLHSRVHGHFPAPAAKTR
ncbi:MAG: LPS export ABC transporter periplasmic protein LptC [Lautropia sp.]|nr:LPS export ABC transporter periplasmic protein LptC [Lautropia sp.]